MGRHRPIPAPALGSAAAGERSPPVQTRSPREFPGSAILSASSGVEGAAVTRFDTIVIGVGGMGSASVYHLAKRGQRVLGIERFDIPHSMGSSHGINRIIRLAYYEHPSYVPLLKRAYELWRDLEQQVGEQLLHITGSIDCGPADSQIFLGSRDSCVEHGLPHEILSGAEVNARFPGYRLPPTHHAVLQPEGGEANREIVAVMIDAEELERRGEGAVLDERLLEDVDVVIPVEEVATYRQ